MAHVVWHDVTRNEMLRAIQEYDRLGPEGFFAEHGFGPTTTYELVWAPDADYTVRLEAAGIGLAHARLRREEELTEADIVAYLAHSRVTEQRASEQGHGHLVLAGRADQGQVQAGAGVELLGLLPGQALAGDDGGARRGPVGRPVLEHLPGLLASAVQLGAGQAEPHHRSLAGADEQQLGSPVPAGVAGAVAVARVPVQVRAAGGDGGLPARDRGGVHQPQQFRRSGGVIGQTAQRGLHQRRGGHDPVVVLGLAQQPGKQVPDLPGRGAQPVPLIVEAQQHLRHGQADQLGVGHLGRLARTGPGEPERGEDPAGQLDVTCDQESV